MMDDHHDLQDTPQGKLVLSAYHGDAQSPTADAKTTYIRSQQPIQPNISAPADPLARFVRQVRTDPAYQVLVVAIVVILIAGIVVASFIGNVFGSSSGGTTTRTSPATAGTVDARPVFPTPGGNNGGQTSSQPPPGQVAPTEQPTDDPNQQVPPTQPVQPTQPPIGTFTIRIINAPGQAQNGTTVPIEVHSSIPGATVRLVITYQPFPGVTQTQAATTGADGNVIIGWLVNAPAGVGGIRESARVMATGNDENGQIATSRAVTVRIVG